MSTIETTTLEEEIAAFAAAVQRQLDDLPAEEVDDLVDGLEADLAEQAAESGEQFELPDAAAYAAELRAAAGLPERARRGAPAIALGIRLRRLPGRVAERIRGNRFGAWLIDLALSLRPVWWIARGAALYWLVALMLGRGAISLYPNEPFPILLLGGFVLVSVQWGREAWLPARWLRAVRTAVSVVAIVALPFLIGNAMAAFSHWQAEAMTTYSPPQPGLVIDGQRVRNIFAYDEAGRPLPQVQLFDQDGRPLSTVGRDGVGGAWQQDEYFRGGGGPVPVAATGTGLQSVWNIYPLREQPAGTGWWDTTAPAFAPPYPFPEVPAANTVPHPSPTSSASPSSTPATTPGATTEIPPGPTPSAVAEPTPSATETPAP